MKKAPSIFDKNGELKINIHKTIKLFVYGTLKRNERLNGYLAGDTSKFIQEDKIKGGLYSAGLSKRALKNKRKKTQEQLVLADNQVAYPIMTEGEQLTPGEIWETDEITYQVIKAMEMGAGYTTKTKKTESGKMVNIFIYEGQNAEYIKENNIKIKQWQYDIKKIKKK